VDPYINNPFYIILVPAHINNLMQTECRFVKALNYMKTENSLKWQWLLLINLAASSCNVGAALLSQLNWDLWRYVGNKEFNDYHFGW
jgi:hypothetical protein